MILGIEFGSTRIKAALLDRHHKTIAAGTHTWENKQKNGLWTYNLEDVWHGLRDVVEQLPAEETAKVQGLGVSAMMHGYLAFDKAGRLLAPFRTWRNTNTERAARELTALFGCNIPLRWSVAHLYQAVLNGEAHVGEIDYITTLAGYVHWQLTGQRVLGIGDASGMFPITNGTYDPAMAEQFQQLTGIDWYAVAPNILTAGKPAGVLQAPLYSIPAHTPLCPPEGDAGTGMVATNAIAARTGNVSAGTSVFAMAVLERPLQRLHTEIDLVTTPDGKPVAMVHSNECTAKIDPWIALFGEALELFGATVERGALYQTLYEAALRQDGARLTVFLRSLLEDAVSGLAQGIRILTEDESVVLEHLAGHGGFFKSGEAGRTVMAQALGIPVTLSATAAEGGAWGMALLADYLQHAGKKSLEQYLNEVMHDA